MHYNYNFHYTYQTLCYYFVRKVIVGKDFTVKDFVGKVITLTCFFFGSQSFFQSLINKVNSEFTLVIFFWRKTPTLTLNRSCLGTNNDSDVPVMMAYRFSRIY